VSPFTYIPEELPIRQIVIWARCGGINFSPTFYCPTHEWIVIIARPGFKLRDRAASGVGDVWRIPQERNNPHPAPFPVELPSRAIETTSTGIVLDPFMGSGSTLVAAKNLNRVAIGIDVEEEYCEMAANRLRAMP
jgi:site-specific DNA-methyltransferase (adenine-specific)